MLLFFYQVVANFYEKHLSEGFINSLHYHYVWEVLFLSVSLLWVSFVSDRQMWLDWLTSIEIQVSETTLIYRSVCIQKICSQTE